MGVIETLLTELKRMLRHPIATDASSLAASQYVAAGLGFITTVVAARVLGAGSYGVAALAMTYPALVWSFVGIKTVSVTTRYIASFRSSGAMLELQGVCKLGYGLDFLLSVGAFVVVCATAWWVAAAVYGMPKLYWLMIAFAASFPFYSLTGTSTAILSSWQRFRALALFQIVDPVITLVLVLGLLLAGFGLAGLIIGTACAKIIVGLAMEVVAARLVQRTGVSHWWHASLSSVRHLQRELAALFGWNYLLITLSGLVTNIPLMVLGRVRGAEEAGFYRLATSIMVAGSYLEVALARIVYPTLSARWSAGERATLGHSLRRWTLRAGLPVGALLLLSVPLLPILVPLVFGAAYAPMVRGAQILMMSAAVSAVVFWLSPLYYASGALGLWTKAQAVYTAAMLVLAWVAIRQWGFLGAVGVLGAGRTLFTIVMALMRGAVLNGK